MSGALKILLAALTAVSVTIGIILGVRQLLPNPVPARVSFVILMDTSLSMKQSFGSSTKFQAVRKEILKFAKGRPDAAIALRFTSGGFCGEDYEEPTITFDRDNAPEIKAALSVPQIAGRSDLVGTITQAVNDFDHYEAGLLAERKSIMAFLGSGDLKCTETTDAVGEIRRALKGFGKDVEFDFFGVGASQAEAARLARLRNSLKSAGYEAHIAAPKNEPELEKAVEETSQRVTDSNVVTDAD